MFSIVITERGGAQRQLDFDAPELSVGRIEDNDVVLPRNNVSKRHARLVLKDERYVLIDLKSTNGTYVNGRKISAPVLVGAGDKIYIGDFILALQDAPRSSLYPSKPELSPSSATPTSAPPARRRSALPPPVPLAALPSTPPILRDTAPPTPASVPPPQPSPPPPHVPALQAALLADDEEENAPRMIAGLSTSAFEERPTAERLKRTSGPALRSPSTPPRMQDPESGLGPLTSPAVLAPSVRLQGALHTLMERLAAHLDLAHPNERAFPSEHQATLDALLAELDRDGLIGPDLDRRFLSQAAISEAVGLGPLDRLLNNRAVREVVVDGPSRILADLGGGLAPVSSFFSSAGAVDAALLRLWARAGKKLGGGPIEEVLLPDGSQLQVLLPPLSQSGPLLSIRCPTRSTTSADSLVTEGMLSIDMLNCLRAAVQRRLNLLVVGPMAAGVSTLLGALASLASDHERIVTLQRVQSLAIAHPHVLPLSLGALPDKTLTKLLRHAARLRADRLVIDDLRGEDALGLLLGAAAMRGVFVGAHAPTPTAALSQLEIFSQMALVGARASLADLVAQAFQILVHVSMDANGVRRVQSIAEIRGARDKTLDVAVLYRYDGAFKSTEQRAAFLSA